MKPNIFLIGFMGAGKTTVGRQLAAEADMEFYDLDILIEEETGQSISELFEKKGEAWFRQLETRVLSDAAKGSGKVLATGGGVVLNPVNMEIMKANGIVVALTAKADTLWERLKDKSDRPLLKGDNAREILDRLYKQRDALYKKAHFTVRVDGKPPAGLAKEIILLTNYVRIFQGGNF